MRAIVITGKGGPEVLDQRDIPSPVPQRGEVRVRVRATALNRADLLQCLGVYPAPADAPADIPGLEYAGEVDAVGEGVTEWDVGDRVFGLVGGGSYAEQLVTPARAVARLPDRLSWTEAAAVPEAFITAYDAMVTQGRLTAGETVLINAVASGVGTAAVQIARAIGARPVGTTRTAGKLADLDQLGLAAGVVVEDGTFAKQVKAAAGGPVDLVLELVGGPYVPESCRALDKQGRLVLVGIMAGNKAEIDLGLVLRNRLQVTGTVLRSRPLEQKIDAMQAFARHLVPLFERGLLRPVVDRVFPLDGARDAHAYMRTNASTGKVVLEVD